MTDVQRRAIAAGFLHALQSTPELVAEWNKIPKTDVAAMGALIQKTMGLSQAPSRDDLHAMEQYVDKSLGEQTSALQEAHPHTVGYFLTQQNS
jgi:hypothetical protein